RAWAARVGYAAPSLRSGARLSRAGDFTMSAVHALAAITGSVVLASVSLAAGPADAQPQAPLVPVLVQYASAPTEADIAELEDLGAVVTRRYHLVPGLAARIPAGLE